jgi:hypothetical protein
MTRSDPGSQRFPRPRPGAPPWPAEMTLQQTAPYRTPQAIHPGHRAAVAPSTRATDAPLAPNRQHRQPPIQHSPRYQPYPGLYHLPATPHRNALFHDGNAVGSPGLAASHRPAVRPRRRPSWLIYAGLLTAVVAAVTVVVGFVSPGLFVVRKLDITQAQAGVEHILTDPAGYGAKRVSDVTCNDGHSPIIHKGESFTCQVTIDRVKQLFVVTLTDDAGSYQVGLPHQATAI